MLPLPGTTASSGFGSVGPVHVMCMSGSVQCAGCSVWFDRSAALTAVNSSTVLQGPIMDGKPITIKSIYKGGEVRRITIPSSSTYQQLVSKMRELHDVRNGYLLLESSRSHSVSISIKYKDNDEDMIALDSDLEWHEVHE